MTGQVPQLDDLDFETLLERARQMIPALSPGWVDHNLHDPGITLVELLAWVTDQQVYAIGHVSRAERLAFARLLGLEPRGWRAAAGLVWPEADHPDGRWLEQGVPVTALGTETPPFELAERTYLTPARIAAVEAHVPGEPPRRLEPGGALPVFGQVPRRDARLVLRLAGALARPQDVQGGLVLTLGVEAEGFLGTEADTAPPGTARLRAALLAGPARNPLPVLRDGTGALAGSGVVRLRVPEAAARAALAAGGVALEFAIAGGAHAIAPRIAAFALNALPILQRATVEPRLLGVGIGLPDQRQALPEELRLADGIGGRPALAVLVEETGRFRRWRLAESLEESGPGDRHAVLEEDGGLRFGNGLNGRIPPRGAQILGRWRATAGADGNLPAGLPWRVPGRAEAFGRTRAPVAGGADADTLANLQIRARAEARRRASLVSDDDLLEAAREAPGFQVARAELLPGGPPGERRLVALRRARASEAGTPPPAEIAAWCDALARHLAKRRLLGEVIRVLPPVPVRVTVEASLTVAPQADAAAVAGAARVLLAARLSSQPGAGDRPWPFGRSLHAVEIAGWLRSLPGVEAVAVLTLAAEGCDGPPEAVDLPPRGLPVLAEPRLRVGRGADREGGR